MSNNLHVEGCDNADDYEEISSDEVSKERTETVLVVGQSMTVKVTR